MPRFPSPYSMQHGAEHSAPDIDPAKLEADMKYYQDPLFDRFRGFRTTHDPRSLQNIILRKQREILQVVNNTKRFYTRVLL